MKKKIAIALILVLLAGLLSGCARKMTPPVFYRDRAWEMGEDGWCFVFIHHGYKDPTADESSLIRYVFAGFNLRHFYGASARTEGIKEGRRYWGRCDEANARDMDRINRLLDQSKTPEELLALKEEDLSFEAMDEELFLRLLRKALTDGKQKEGELRKSWEKPTTLFLAEPDPKAGYRFQLAFIQYSGVVDELYIDVRYDDASSAVGFVQLSDMIEEGTASPEQIRLWERLKGITETIKESELFINGNEAFRKEHIAGVDLNRLYKMLKDVHNNKYDAYIN